MNIKLVEQSEKKLLVRDYLLDIDESTYRLVVYLDPENLDGDVIRYGLYNEIGRNICEDDRYLTEQVWNFIDSL